MTPSLLIGSDVLGWEPFPTAILGIRTKQMPGGDGSLDFSVPGDFAHKHRNLLVPEAQVVLTVDGEVDFGGYLTCDPLRHRLGVWDTVELVATGPWGMAARSNRYAYLGIDTDMAQWHQYRGIGEHSGRFTLDIEGRIEIRASSDRSYDDGDACRIYYWLDQGLLSPNSYCTGIDFEYKLYLPDTHWECGILASQSPVGTGMDTVYAWPLAGLKQGPLTVSDWTPVTADFDLETIAAPCLIAVLECSNTGALSGDDPKFLLRKVHVYGRYVNGATTTADRTLTIADVLTDCAADLGVTTTRITGLTTSLEEFVARYPTNIAAVIGQATLLEAAPVEAYFDHTGSAFRFTANTRPATVDATRNRLWSVGGRGGEDLSKLVRDWEATPEQVEVLYAVKNHATVPDGMVKAARYPASVTATFPLVESVDLTGEPPMTAALAAQYAQVIYAARQASLYAGDVVLGETALTSTGQEVATVKLRPGDRIGVPSRLDVDVAGLYVQGVSYDYRNARCAVTVGEPWDPLGWRPRTVARQTLGSKGHVQTKTTRYLRRGGVT